MSLRGPKKRFALLMQQEGKCYWCGCRMALRIQDGGQIKSDEVTIDHLDDRFSPDRGKFSGQIRQVGACYNCNWLRGRESELATPIEELRERSQRYKE